MDLRFHGESDSPEFGQRISRLAMDVSDLIEHERLSDVAMVGHSMGVSVGLAYVSLAGGDALSKFVAIDQSPRIINDANWPWGVRGVGWTTMRAQLDGELGWGDPSREPEPSAGVLAMLENAGGIMDFQTSPLAALKLDHFVSDWSDVVPELRVPTWVVTGGHSPSFPLEGMEWFASTAPDGRLTVYEDSGHCPHWNEYSAFNRDLIEFLRADDRPAPNSRP